MSHFGVEEAWRCLMIAFDPLGETWFPVFGALPVEAGGGAGFPETNFRGAGFFTGGIVGVSVELRTTRIVKVQTGFFNGLSNFFNDHKNVN
jgi:hypothetical protein